MLDKFDKNKNPFKVPENYFGNFNTEIMGKLPEKRAEKARVVPLWKRIVPWTAVAAVFFGILFTTGVFKHGVTDNVTIADQHDAVISNGIASSLSIEDDYFLFLEDEVATAKYKEIMYSN